MDRRKVIYYKDELGDEFSTAQITPKPIDESYVYVHTSAFKRFTHFFWYRVVATPLAFAYTALALRHKVVGAEVFKDFRDTGFFLFGNHTHAIGDALVPNVMAFPRHLYMIVHPNNVSMPFLGKITPSLGALPLPDDRKTYRNFMAAIDFHLQQKHPIVVYPEAHIWPYYTKIRPFPDTSFSYPIKYGVPSFCFTNTYQKRRFSKKPRTVTYVDGPFYPDDSLPLKEQKKDLRDRIYKRMCERAAMSTVEQIQYIKQDENDG